MADKRRVAVVVDSSSCLPPELVQRWHILVAPHELVIGQTSFRDGVDITATQFYHLLRSARPSTTTSAPTPATFLEAFRGASETAEAVLCITIAASFSASYDAAQAAARQAQRDLPALTVRVLNSRAAAGAEGFIALEAARAAARGDDLEGVTLVAEQIICRVRLLAFLDTLHYLARSGKVSRAKAWAGTVLGIKPLVEMKLDRPMLLERPRSRARAISRLLEAMRARAGTGPIHVNVMHADAPEDAEYLRRRVDQEFYCQELFVSQFTPVMGAHTGPGLLGLAFYAEP